MFCASCGKEIPAGSTFCPSCGAPVQGAAGASGTTSAPVSGMETLTKDQKAQEYWVQRLIAIIIDAVIVGLVLIVLTVLIALPALFTGGFALFGIIAGGLGLVWGLLFVLYNAAMETYSGASIGKRVLGLRVVDRKNANPTFGEAFVRNVSKIYWLLLLLDVIVGLAISHGYQEKYSDHFMGTKVVGGSWHPTV